MKKTLKALKLGAISDLFVTTSKLLAGFYSGSSALIADGFYTLSNFITDILAIIGITLTKKRPNRTHPFGYGKVEYLINIFIGVIIFLLGILIFFISFTNPTSRFANWIYIILLICIGIKICISHYLLKVGKETKSNLLISTAKIALIDTYSTGTILIILTLSNLFHHHIIFQYLDTLVSIIISFEILKLAYQLLKENMLAIIGEVDQNSDLMKQIEETVEAIPHVDLVDIQLIKYGSYYKASLKISLNPDIKLKQLIKIEQIINKKIKKKKFGIKYTTIEIVPEK